MALNQIPPIIIRKQRTGIILQLSHSADDNGKIRDKVVLAVIIMKVVEIKLPFGLNENNIIVHIADIESGDKCNLVCPSCKSPLIAVKGNKKQHHFRHKNFRECKGGLESAIHLAAKQMIMEKKQITLPKYVLTVSARDSKGLKHTEDKIFLPDTKIIYFDSVQDEKDLHGMRADILASKGSNLMMIEIYYRHKVDDQKIEKIKNANISAIEINLSYLMPENVKDLEAFWLYINDSKHVQWLHNAKAQIKIYPELVNRLAVKIQGGERKYDALKEQVKAELVQDLNIVKMHRSKKYRAKSTKELMRNFVWQVHGEGSHLSLEQLPNFLNLYVADGDWIFGCDRRIWQAVIYHSFICNSNREPYFYVGEVAGHIKLYCNIARCVERLQEFSRYHPDLVPPEALENMPSAQKTVRAYCIHLCELGILEFSGHDSHYGRDFQFHIISKTPDAINQA